ncbi:MAG: hypothetical protein HON23_00895 [Rickettsiales bacterium]|jgi:hypothetical protein|nr:hypothetical protein [Rickettsiales bacterium]
MRQLRQIVRSSSQGLFNKQNYTTQVSNPLGTLTTIGFPLVIRDRGQSGRRNADTAFFDPYGRYTHHVHSGFKKPSYIEDGGQTSNASMEIAERPASEGLSQVAIDTRSGPIRYLTRHTGNRLKPMHKDDLQRWYRYVDRHGVNVIFKLFHFNNKFRELEQAIDIIVRNNYKLELAIPHTPGSEHMPFFIRKVREAILILKDIPEGKLSVKRMVTGLTIEEAREMAHIIFPLALEHGVDEVSLHAHGNCNGMIAKACAEFIAIGIEHGIKAVNADTVPGLKYQNTLFPTVADITHELYNAHGIEARPRGEELERFDEINHIQGHIVEPSLAGVNVSGFWSDHDKLFMGMPDGGESFSVAAIQRSGICTSLNINLQQAGQIFKFYYRNNRDNISTNSVTPGHAIVETMTNIQISNTIDDIKKFAASKGKAVYSLDQDELRELYDTALKSIPLKKLYANIPADYIDTFRDGVSDDDAYSRPFSPEIKELLCEMHMEHVLKQDTFKDLSQDLKDRLVSASRSKQEVCHIVLVARHQAEPSLLHDMLLDDTQPYNQRSLVQAAGGREYIEMDKVGEVGPRLEEQFREEGLSGKALQDKVAEAISVGTDFIENMLKNGPAPSPHTLTSAGFVNATAVHKMDPQQRIQEVQEWLSYHDPYEDYKEKEQPQLKFDPTGKYTEMCSRFDQENKFKAMVHNR